MDYFCMLLFLNSLHLPNFLMWETVIKQQKVVRITSHNPEVMPFTFHLWPFALEFGLLTKRPCKSPNNIDQSEGPDSRETAALGDSLFHLLYIIIGLKISSCAKSEDADHPRMLKRKKIKNKILFSKRKLFFPL